MHDDAPLTVVLRAYELTFTSEAIDWHLLQLWCSRCTRNRNRNILVGFSTGAYFVVRVTLAMDEMHWSDYLSRTGFHLIFSVHSCRKFGRRIVKVSPSPNKAILGKFRTLEDLKANQTNLALQFFRRSVRCRHSSFRICSRPIIEPATWDMAARQLQIMTLDGSRDFPGWSHPCAKVCWLKHHTSGFRLRPSILIFGIITVAERGSALETPSLIGLLAEILPRSHVRSFVTRL